MRARRCRAGLGLFVAAFLLGTRTPAPGQPEDPSRGRTPVGNASAEPRACLTDCARRAATRWLARHLDEAARQIESGAKEVERAADAVLDHVPTTESHEPSIRFLTNSASPGAVPAWAPLERVAGDLPERVVLLVHGMDEPGSIWDDLAPALGRASLPVARFDYPNDQALARSAEMLAAALAALRARGAVRVDLVGHSAGGLLVRDVLTRAAPGMYAGRPRGHAALPDIGRVIMLGTPNHGSALARLRVIAEIRDHAERWIVSPAKSDLTALLGFLEDGDGQAGDDIDPGSAYLADLNSRPLPPGGPDGVAFTVVVARIALDGVDEALALVVAPPLVGRALGEEADDLRARIAGTAQLLGDGVVPIDSQVLDGVEDVVYVDGNHRSMVRRIELPGVPRRSDAPEPPAIRIILDRLAEPKTAPRTQIEL